MGTLQIAQKNSLSVYQGQLRSIWLLPICPTSALDFQKPAPVGMVKTLVINVIFTEYLLISTSHRNVSINLHQHVNFFPPPFPPLSPSDMWVVKHQEDSSRPFVLHIHLWINFHQSIQLTQGIHTNHLAHITWEDWPGVGGDEGRFAKWSLFKKETGPKYGDRKGGEIRKLDV